MNGGAQPLAAEANSAEPPYRDSPRCLLKLERDGTLRVLSVSAALADLFQKSAAALAGKSAQVLGTDTAVLIDAVRMTLATADVIELDLAVTLARGAIPCRFVLMRQPDGETVHLLLIDLRPRSVTPEPSADLGEDLLIRFRGDLTVVDCSDSYAQFHNRRKADLIGHRFSEWLPPAEVEIIARAVAAAAGNGKVINTNEIAKTQPDGSQRWYRWVDVALPVRAGEEPEYLALGLNITGMQRAREALQAKNAALIEAAEELREAQIAAEDSNRAKSRFLAHMSHELRTPLNSIIGFADVMRAGLFGSIEPARYRDYVDLIHNSGELLLSLINDILDMSKIEAGRMELSVQPLEVASLAEACRTMVIGMARDGSVVIKVEIAPGCVEVHADPRAAQQMIINLLSNAVKFTRAGGVVTLSFRNRRSGDDKTDGVSISVSDNGIGMTPEELEKAMLPFGQIDSELARQRKGTGIGLTLVKSLVELHGGTLDIVSAKDLGTTATLTLPWLQPAA